MKQRTASLVISCEHGGNRIPSAYRAAFADARPELASHRGYDAGALTVARDLARSFNAALVATTVSRLLVELNRSPGHPQIFSEFSRELPRPVRADIIRRYYEPYRHDVERAIVGVLRQRHCAIHISSHSFTPVLRGEQRNADIGLLYDPRCPAERTLCLLWQAELQQRQPGLRVRRNYPYRGAADGLTTHLRRRLPAGYLGIELEVNQQQVAMRSWPTLRRALITGLTAALDQARFKIAPARPAGRRE